MSKKNEMKQPQILKEKKVTIMYFADFCVQKIGKKRPHLYEVKVGYFWFIWLLVFVWYIYLIAVKIKNCLIGRPIFLKNAKIQ